jgi:hypothetical protein
MTHSHALASRYRYRDFRRSAARRTVRNPFRRTRTQEARR